ncbi:MAG: hypothetical protein AAF497_26200, partial [Planctomycetota bacterium]
QRVLNVDVPFELGANIVSKTTQDIDGISVGLYGSYTQSGYFIDFLGKVDFWDIERRTATSRPLLRFNVAPFVNGGPNPALVVDQITGCIVADTDQQNDPNGQPGVRDGRVEEFLPFDQLIVQDGFAGPEIVVERAKVTNLLFAFNIGRRFDQVGGWWWQPSGGLSYTHTIAGDNASALGLDDGYSLRVRGGVTLGLAKKAWAGEKPILWNTSVGGFLYSDVVIDGFVTDDNPFSVSSVEDDQGKIRFEGVLRNEIDFLNGSLLYVETSGRVGEDIWGWNGKAGIRIRW